MDDLDRRLLDQLQRDAGQTLHELGELVGLSASAVQRRITRYRASGLLTREIAVLDAAKLGGMLFVVLVALERESHEHHRRFAERMRGTPEVQQCYELAGRWDYLVVLSTSDMARCRELGDELFQRDDNVQRYETMPVFDAVKTGLAVSLS
ncbi:DNA-binding Lrp family transcriptional regulator [Saccharothrix tamanrassetensis]|uniref:DNA-binding Lrp family transcriptional regulator n=1 Tax=Saccharothrix tamanrassetensis TaxID=1051531 RepID=A0A841CHR4_9PSEU|nr:Lrp/AsnC family transcriptional regulator [Saccharothrix tamanrassetensis]MBB5956523.1 DNA-binding Lrp family transcriptional regulator [Saccharothrix tamanrassetensis]